ncbi:hypothetical protein EVG20_g6994 [Dentipellis fragilis]|uniref:Uncharacterized protein n=1 Tax=Dentipellis fragilis TaxID=205917 RepID=A0A4Y9YIC9_9AGAM|nr:hypothetical protein EVG20_g6994 [Dentipellis fragilis]
MSTSWEHNDVLLTRHNLPIILQDLSKRLLAAFGHQVRLLVHGGAVVVLHQELQSRKSTRDIDYIHRAFVAEYRRYGIWDAGERLKACIAQTAQRFRLGGDWMNSHADVALPMARDAYGREYDPIAHCSLVPKNLEKNVIYETPGLQLVGVMWAWGLALKFVRYKKDDPDDIAAILRLAYWQRGIRWSRQSLEDWITSICWPMGYSNYPPPHLDALRNRMRHAIHLAHGQRYAQPC